METTLEAGAQGRLEEYFNRLGHVLGNDSRRASFALYATGLLGDCERKSVEPIAARVCADPALADAVHQRLLHFIANARWSDPEIRREAARYALSALVEREPIGSWIIDDTGFVKQGKHSVGVQRQYTGSAGKVTNCQIGVSLSLASRTAHLPIDFDLYIPKSWTDDPIRRREARIPAALVFQTKPQLALNMMRRAIADGMPRGVVLADAGYGDSSEFRNGVRHLGLDYAVAVSSNTKVWLTDSLVRRCGAPISVADLATQNLRGFRRTTWREGTSERLSARFVLRRVIPYHDDGISPSVREDVCLLMEWEDSASKPTKFHFVNLAPGRQSRKRLVRLIKQRWRTERVYQDMKGELGLDHFEGRSFLGWHHHVSVALSCYAYVAAEQARRFPPSVRQAPQDSPQSLAA
jgi:SRSO17 transposase